MAKHQTCTLSGALLDAAVAKARGWTRDPMDPDGWWSPDGKIASSITERGIAWGYGFHPAHFWSDGGPIIEQERIKVDPGNWDDSEWLASCPVWYPDGSASYSEADVGGPTPLIAAMRAYVASRFGEEVELP